MVGVRHLIGFEAVDYIAREDVHEGLQVIINQKIAREVYTVQIGVEVTKEKSIIKEVIKMKLRSLSKGT